MGIYRYDYAMYDGKGNLIGICEGGIEGISLSAPLKCIYGVNKTKMISCEDAERLRKDLSSVPELQKLKEGDKDDNNSDLEDLFSTAAWIFGSIGGTI